MNQEELFIFGLLIIVVPFIIGWMSSKGKPAEPLLPFRVVIEPIPKPPKQENKSPRPQKIKEVKPPDFTKSLAFNEAKSALVSMGYKAGPVKDLLKNLGPCNSAEDYIQKALTRNKL